MSTIHIISPEFPPRVGGVSDHTDRVARGLAEAGEHIHVWTGGRSGVDGSASPPEVHRDAGGFSARDLWRLDTLLDRYPRPRRLLVQWVPQSYGYRSMNLPFCLWLLGRRRKGDRVEVMVHEPWLAFRRGGVRRNAVATIHRLMTTLLIRASSQIWVSAPLWGEFWKRYSFGKEIRFTWLPLPNGIPVVRDDEAVAALRTSLAAERGQVIGCFGLTPVGVPEILAAWLPAILQRDPNRTILLLGRGSGELHAAILESHPELGGRVRATGTTSAHALSVALQACDLMVQPFVGGVNARRSSVVAALAHGLPVVTTDGSFTEAFWRETQGVALTPEDDRPAAVRLIDELSRVRELRDALAARGRRVYEDHFHIRHAIAALRGEPEWTRAGDGPIFQRSKGIEGAPIASEPRVPDETGEAKLSGGPVDR